jgi:peptide-methionine (R)-S-oxide reductase
MGIVTVGCAPSRIACSNEPADATRGRIVLRTARAPLMNTSSNLSASGHDLTPLSPAQIEHLAAGLSAEERHVILHQGTERPFCGTLLNNKERGLYACRLCGLPLFKADAKFESGTGWPSFHQPYDPRHILELRDSSHGMIRTEIRCQRCDAHLGHVFPDGPPPTGQRYCLNSVSLSYFAAGTQPKQHTAAAVHND